ncbi:nedd8 ultimate buster 1-like [Plakobranchus ocellatus]|uniref:Nedd8 ultimate buster 1-like n=1 Tax=Plakobranchus ocellatus TaxID=259542 RepID=A0AAV3ZXA6_9GAST|nr:nedd8 ultimate buster 1-like [Plakobranchus ocellatus]
MDVSRDLLVKQLRDCLNADKVKLWMPPYTAPDKSKGESPDALIIKYSQQLGALPEEVTQILEELRLHALAKLDEREKFRSHGLATLRVRVAGPVPAEKASKKPVPLECQLLISGSELKSLVSAQFDLSSSLLKLICQGRIITENQSLEEQGIKNGSDILAIFMTSSEAQIAGKEAEIAEVKRTRQTAELLSARGDEARLQASEAGFKRSYGEKMERLAALKGGTGTEQALLMRLYLLQGIVAFHKGDIREAGILFKRAEFVLSLLHVDDNSLNEIMLMGFSEREARLALRAKSGNVQNAVDFIMEKRKEKEEMNKKSKQAWQQRVRSKKLGKTAGGEMVNVESFDNLVSMGFPPGAAAESLRLADNSFNLAIEILNTRPELMSLPDPENKRVLISDEMIQQVISLGFDVDVARRALEISCGSIQRAVDQLLRTGGILPSTSASASSASDSVSAMSASSSESDLSTTENGESYRRKREEEKAHLESFMSDISKDHYDHLDLALVEERDVLNVYKALVKDLSTSRPA